MEAFKLVEREMKTKAYSKEGLARTQAMSEEERKRMKAREWVQDAVSRLGDEIEEMEKEVETIAESGKGTKKEREIETHLENVIKTHKLHQDKLEALTRLLDNGDVKPEDVDGIQEDVNYYISQARRPDDSTFEADFGIYDSFELLAEEAAEDHPEDDEDEAAVLARASAAAAKSALVAAAAATSTTAAGIGAPPTSTPTAALAGVGGGGAPITQNSQLPHSM
jgi:CCR4-NOT transcription complex subunit 3